MERKLAAIFAADVVGYSRLMAANEAETLSRLQSLLREIIEPRIHEFGGRVVKLMGDGLLADFSSTVNAVKCAVEVQQAISDQECSRTDDDRICLRIGINLGDVIIDGDDMFGDGVNIAARLEGLSEPNGICLSGTAFDTVDGKLEHHFEEMGPQKVKNIAKPVCAYRLSLASHKIGKPESPLKHLPLPDKPSIAVLAFDDISPGGEQGFLADGITEEVITTLSRVSKLFVITRNSVLPYKGIALDLREAGQELGVHYVLEGSVRGGGNRVRISAQLIEAATGHHLWARRFDREVNDVFALQDELTKEIVSALQVELTEGEQARLAANNTRNFEAWQLAFEGRDLVHLHRKESVRKGRKLIEQATELDPNYAFAWGSLAEAHWKEAANEGWSADPERSLELALETSDRALALDPENADVLSMRSVILVTMRDFDGALRLAQEALRVAHSEANAIALATITLRSCGLAEEGLRQLALAKRHCRVFPAWYPYNEALCYWILQQSDEAIAALHRATSIDREFSLAYALLAAIHAENGDAFEARKALEELLRADPLFSADHYTESRPFRDPDLSLRLRNAMREANLPD